MNGCYYCLIRIEIHSIISFTNNRNEEKNEDKLLKF